MPRPIPTVTVGVSDSGISVGVCLAGVSVDVCVTGISVDVCVAGVSVDVCLTGETTLGRPNPAGGGGARVGGLKLAFPPLPVAEDDEGLFGDKISDSADEGLAELVRWFSGFPFLPLYA